MKKGKLMTKAFACMLAASVSLGSAVPAAAATSSPEKPPVLKEQPSVKTDDQLWILQVYKNGRTKALFRAKATGTKTFKIPKKVKIQGITCQINELGAESLDKLDSVTKIILPSTVTKLNAKSFAGCKNLKTIVFRKGKRFPVIRKDAFKGLNTKKMTIRISKKFSKKHFKIITRRLRTKGFKGKIVR